MKGDPFEIWWDNMFAQPSGADVATPETVDITIPLYNWGGGSELPDNQCVIYDDTNVTAGTGWNSSYMITTANYTPALVKFYDSSGQESLTINFDTGDVVLSDKMSIDGSAGLFWDAVIKMNPITNRTQLDDIEDRLVGKIDDYFNCVVIPEIDNRIGTKVETLPVGPFGTVSGAPTKMMELLHAKYGPDQLRKDAQHSAYERAMKVVK